MNRQAISILLTLLTVVVILRRPSQVVAQDSCQPVFEALTKVVTTASHSYSNYTLQAGRLPEKKSIRRARPLIW